jgi:hypothetical protein
MSIKTLEEETQYTYFISYICIFSGRVEAHNTTLNFNVKINNFSRLNEIAEYLKESNNFNSVTIMGFHLLEDGK